MDEGTQHGDTWSNVQLKSNNLNEDATLVVTSKHTKDITKAIQTQQH